MNRDSAAVGIVGMCITCCLLVFGFLVRNSVVLAVYLLFSVACFFTVHEHYPKDKKPLLRIDILDEIKRQVSVPLVLHGGSSNKDTKIAKAVAHGVNKINISSDIKDPFYRKCREMLKDDAIREPNRIYPPCIEVLKNAAIEKIKLFQADGRAALYE